MQTLMTNLAGAGRSPVPLCFPDGSRLLVLLEGGRLLGLYPPDGGANFLWTNPALDTVKSTAAFFARPGWPNPGGDRTWLAPEIDLFIDDVARPLETYTVPPALDPGRWTQTSAGGAELSLTNDARLRLRRSGRQVRVLLSKTFRPAANPLQDTPLADASLRYAGYTQDTSIELEPGVEPALRLGIWNLLQLPQPGEMRIPTRTATPPQFVFGTPAQNEVVVTPNQVSWHMGHSGESAKIAIKAASLTGRAGYLRTSTPGIADLVIREFDVDLGGDYVDALWAPPHETGWTFQACGVRDGDARFNELEYHAPAGANRGRDQSRVWAFRGPATEIAEAAKSLLQSARAGTA